jgi:hypothetical protein
MGAVVLIALIMGIIQHDIVPVLFFAAIVCITPLSNIFLILNIWGILKRTGHRVRYGILIVLLILWGLYGWYALLTAPLP